MKRFIRAAVLGVCVAAMSSFAFAGENASGPEAMALVKKAVAYFKANGKEKTLSEISNPKGAFRDRDLYITVVDMDGKMLAHGANERLIGKDLLELKDSDGKTFVKDYIALAKSNGSGWIDFKWPNPTSHKVEDKSFYFVKVDNMVFGSGIYK